MRCDGRKITLYANSRDVMTCEARDYALIRSGAIEHKDEIR